MEIGGQPPIPMFIEDWDRSFCCFTKKCISLTELFSFHGDGEVYIGQHAGVGQGQVAVSIEWEKVQRTRVCAETHYDEAHGKTGRTQERRMSIYGNRRWNVELVAQRDL